MVGGRGGDGLPGAGEGKDGRRRPERGKNNRAAGVRASRRVTAGPAEHVNISRHDVCSEDAVARIPLPPAASTASLHTGCRHMVPCRPKPLPKFGHGMFDYDPSRMRPDRR